MASDALLQLIGDTHSLLDLDEFRVELLAALRRAVPAEWVSLNDIGSGRNDAVVLADPEPQRICSSRSCATLMRTLSSRTT